MPMLKLDPVTHDLVLGEDVTDEEQIRQHVKIRLLIVKGEVVWDTDLGVPYLGEVTEKGASPARLGAIFREVILDTPGIDEITEGPVLEGPDESNKLTLTFRASTDVGELDFSEELIQ